ncbi:coiled-coil domain-containing glutamate-rich protein 2 [Ambystoma mexicanum]|uniref:coiled-coil domain-containing glutamate-rich protein 2 n=1 Tax=Ambystoma mexicanum TaxID=8296 RepID=UPI0037E9BDF2
MVFKPPAPRLDRSTASSNRAADAEPRRGRQRHDHPPDTASQPGSHLICPPCSAAPVIAGIFMARCCHAAVMVPAGCLLLMLLCSQASSVPLSTQLSEEEEKVSKCIMEVLADSLSKPSPAPVSSECRRILKEDERIVSMLHHQHLMRELEELNHRENAKHRFGHDGGRSEWEEEEENSDEDEVKKRNQEGKAAQKKDTEKRGPAAATDSSAKEVKTRGSETKRDHEDIKEYEKTEKIEEKLKEEKVSHTDDDTKVRMEEAKELLQDEDEEDEEEKKKRGSPGKRSREYFDEDKRKDHENDHHGAILSEILERLSKDAHHATKKMEDEKKHFSDEGNSEEEEEEFRHGGFHEGHKGGHHREHENWEDEEEEKRSGAQQRSVNKRMDEKASDEETAQFEAEEKGLKISNMKSHLHGSHGVGHLSEKPWEDKRHFHHHEGASEEEELRKRHHEEEPYLKKHHEEEEEEREEEQIEEREATKKEEQELENLEDIEYELKKAAEKLRELHRG